MMKKNMTKRQDMPLKGVSRNSIFTLIEIVVSMGVFSVLMVVLLSFLNSAQKAWSAATNQSMLYENARVAMDMIGRDLQSAFYENEHTPFWHGAYADGTWGSSTSNDLLAFISATSLAPNNHISSRICEIKYQKYFADDHTDSKDGWLMRSVTKDKNDNDTTNSKWNYYDNFAVGKDTGTNAFTANEDSSGYQGASIAEDFQKVIPYVIELSFTCYDRTGTVIPKNTTVAAPVVTPFPYSVGIKLAVMDKSAWDKWCALDADPYHATVVLTADAQSSEESNPAWDFRQKNQRVFTKTVILGERGQ